MSRFIAVGDLHGCSQTLAKLLAILDLGPEDTFLCTGDLSSKGEDARGVHQLLLDLEARGVRVIVLLGNHELMLLAMQRAIGASVDVSALPPALFRGADVSFFVRDNETWATLKSYGRPCADDPEFWAFRSDHPQQHFDEVIPKIDRVDWMLPQSHIDFLCRCKTHHIERNCVFVHSGFRTTHLQQETAKQAIASQLQDDPREICWTRESLGQSPGFGELMIHGHTPLWYLHSYVGDTQPWKDDELVFKSSVHNGALNLDSGVFLEAGHLTAVEISESGRPEELQFIRVPRLDPVSKDRLWHYNYR